MADAVVPLGGQGKVLNKIARRKTMREAITGVTNPAIRRLARRGGVKRISNQMYEETREILKAFVETILRDATTYTEFANRRTVSALDVVHSLKRNGRTLYGYGQ